MAQITTLELQNAVDVPSRPRAPKDTDFQGSQGVD